MQHCAAVVVVVPPQKWRPIVTGVWRQSNNCVNSQSSQRRVEAVRRGLRDGVIGGQLAKGLSQLALTGRISTVAALPSQRDLRRDATDVGEPVPYAPGDGEVSGGALPAGKTPAPESGATEEPAPGEAWNGVVAGEDSGEGCGAAVGAGEVCGAACDFISSRRNALSAVLR
jgi:hypothetical protein